MRNFALSFTFLLFELLLIYLLNLFLFWTLNTFVFDLLNWFNDQNFFFKLVLIIIGGVSLLYLILGLLSAVLVIITQPVFNRMPINTFTTSVAFIAFLANSAFVIYKLWGVVEHYYSWTVIELLLLSVIIISLNWTVLANRKKIHNSQYA